MSSEGVIENLESIGSTWNNAVERMWGILLIDPKAFGGGDVWELVKTIVGSLQAVAVALLVIFWLVHFMNTLTMEEVSRADNKVIKAFIRLGLTFMIIVSSMDISLILIETSSGLANTIANAVNYQTTFSNPTIPENVIEAVNAMDGGNWYNLNWGLIGIWLVTFLIRIGVWAMGIYFVFVVYGRTFLLYIYTALAPIPLSSLGSKETENQGISLLKSFAGVALKVVVLAMAFIIYSIFISSSMGSGLFTSANDSNSGVIYSYLAEVVFNALVLVGVVKGADMLTNQIFGL